AGYDEARKVWNAMIDKRPAVIVRCTGAADVREALRFARAQGLLVAVRGGGHNVAGFSTCDGGVVIDLSPMRGVIVDPVRRRARVQAGALWKQVDHEAQTFGLATTGGLVSHTGVAGLTLGGGVGWLMRKLGLACDNLLSAQLVTADGAFVTASEENDPELLWALRGGGGNFGIVTSFEFQLHEAGPMVLGGPIIYPAKTGADLLRFYRDWVQTLPDEMTTLVAFFTAPPLPFIPIELQGKLAVALITCHVGEFEAGAALLDQVRAALPPMVDHAGEMPYVALQQMFDAAAPWGFHNYGKTEYVSTLSDDAIDTVTSWAARMTSPLSALHVHHLGGAVARGGVNSSFAHREAPFLINVPGMWAEPSQAEAEVKWVRDTAQALHPFAAAGLYLNFMDGDDADKVAAAYGPNYQRLREVKRRFDPENVFRLNQNILPA
ncbi:MAG TPA: FAD-binding oxidoreductase, partial [Dehalococcoidia bacterium]